MKTLVTYKAVLEYEDGDVPVDPKEEMHGLISREPDFGQITVEEVSDEYSDAVSVTIHGVRPDEIRADDDSSGHPSDDDAVAIANDIHRLLQENYSYLDVDGVSVDTGNVSSDDAPDFPEDWKEFTDGDGPERL